MQGRLPAVPRIGRERRPRLGISSCLLGSEVRHDGGHKRDRYLTESLGRFVEWVPVCPEVEVGMGIPREPVRLVKRAGDVRMIGVKSESDWTRRMLRHARSRVRALCDLDLSGYVFKRGSPSCGMERVRVYGKKGVARKGRGLFAEVLITALPELPVEEEGRLRDPVLRENFIERLFAYRRLRELFDGRWTMAQLIAFHMTHKLQIMSHASRAHAELGRLLGGGRSLARADLRRRYQHGFMAALRKQATPPRHANVLHHAVGFFKKKLGTGARRELLGLIEDHRRGLVPLIVPITLIRHHVRTLGVEYLEGQHYLEPHPRELMLRNHV